VSASACVALRKHLTGVPIASLWIEVATGLLLIAKSTVIYLVLWYHAPCRPFYELAHTDSSSMLVTAVSRATCMWNAKTASRSSGSIQSDFRRVAASGEPRYGAFTDSSSSIGNAC